MSKVQGNEFRDFWRIYHPKKREVTFCRGDSEMDDAAESHRPEPSDGRDALIYFPL